LDKEIIKEDFITYEKSPCCPKQCFQNVSLFEIVRIRENFWIKNEEEQNLFIVEFLNLQKAIHKITYYVNSITICQSFWLFCYGISKARYDNL